MTVRIELKQKEISLSDQHWFWSEAHLGDLTCACRIGLCTDGNLAIQLPDVGVPEGIRKAFSERLYTVDFGAGWDWLNDFSKRKEYLSHWKTVNYKAQWIGG